MMLISEIHSLKLILVKYSCILWFNYSPLLLNLMSALCITDMPAKYNLFN